MPIKIHKLTRLLVFQLSFDLVEDWIKENPEASICTLKGVSQFKDIALFQDYHGLSAFRNVFNLSLS